MKSCTRAPGTPRYATGRPLSLQRHVANARGGGTIETILLEGVGLFLCSDARGRKIEMLDQGSGLRCCEETSYHPNDTRVLKLHVMQSHPML